MSTKTRIKVALLGDGSVGKSCLTLQFTQKSFMKQYDPTIENAYSKLVYVDGESVDLEIIDTAGQEEYQVMRGQYIRSADGFLLVYSVAARSSLDTLHEIYAQIQHIRTKSTPIVLLGNKCDLTDLREVSKEDGEALARKMSCFCFESSAKNGYNVEEAFTTLIREVINSRTAPTTPRNTKNGEEGDKKNGKDGSGSRRRSQSVPGGLHLFRTESLKNLKEKMKRHRANTVTHGADGENSETGDDSGSEGKDREKEPKGGSVRVKRPAKNKATRSMRSSSFRFHKKTNGSSSNSSSKDEIRVGGKERCIIS